MKTDKISFGFNEAAMMNRDKQMFKEYPHMLSLPNLSMLKAWFKGDELHIEKAGKGIFYSFTENARPGFFTRILNKIGL